MRATAACKEPPPASTALITPPASRAPKGPPPAPSPREGGVHNSGATAAASATRQAAPWAGFCARALKREPGSARGGAVATTPSRVRSVIASASAGAAPRGARCAALQCREPPATPPASNRQHTGRGAEQHDARGPAARSATASPSGTPSAHIGNNGRYAIAQKCDAKDGRHAASGSGPARTTPAALELERDQAARSAHIGREGGERRGGYGQGAGWGPPHLQRQHPRAQGIHPIAGSCDKIIVAIGRRIKGRCTVPCACAIVVHKGQALRARGKGNDLLARRARGKVGPSAPCAAHARAGARGPGANRKVHIRRRPGTAIQNVYALTCRGRQQAEQGRDQHLHWIRLTRPSLRALLQGSAAT